MATDEGRNGGRRSNAADGRPAHITEIDISRHARALRVLRLTDYGLVVVCGLTTLNLVGDLLVGEPGEDASAVGIQCLIIAIVGFAAVTGWRHVGVIEPRVWRAYAVALPLLAGLVAAFAWFTLRLLNGPASAVGPEAVEVITGMVVMGPVGVLALAAFLTVLQLQRMPVEPFGLRLSELLARLGRRAGERVDRQVRVPKAKALRGCLLAAAGLAMFVAPQIPAVFDFFVAHRDGAHLARTLQGAAGLLMLYARQCFQVDADALLAVDARAPILFLRSFADDERWTYQGANRSMLDFSLETRLANHFHRFGPFVAIGSPKDSVPQLGAARVLLPDDQWQQRVLGWMRAASVIVMYGGKTPWVNWELRRVLDSGQATRLILLIPEVRGWWRGKRERDLDARMAQIRAAFQGSLWQEELAACTDIAALRALLFREDGSVVMVRSRSRCRDSYHLAALVAHHVMLDSPALPQRVVAGAAAAAPSMAGAGTGAQPQPG